MSPRISEQIENYGRSGSERRLSARFPFAEGVRFRVLDRRGAQYEGTGITVDMSRSGLLFTTEMVPERGRLVECSVNWPVELEGGCPLKLVAIGHVVRSGGGAAAVKIEKYQFRTRGRATLPPRLAPALTRA